MPTIKTTTARPRKKKVIMDSEINVPPVLELIEEENRVSPRSKFRDSGEFSPTPRFYRTIALSFLFVAVVLILGVFYFTLGKADISLFLKPKNVKIDFLLTVGSGVEGQNKISGVVFQNTLTGEKVVPVKNEGIGLVGSPSQAMGKVTIFNETEKDQTLIATTRLLSPDNILFRMKKTLVIPAKGNVDSDVYADKPGLEGEIAPTKFIIPGLSLELQKVIFAESQEKMIGGTKFSRKLVEEDLKRANEDLVRELFEKGKQQMLKTNSTGTLDSYVFNSSLVSTKTDAKVGQEVETFKVSAEVKLVGVFYSSKELNKVLGSNLRDSLNDNEIVVGNPSLPQIEFSKLNQGNSAELKVTQEATAQVSYLEDVIDKDKILGQKRAAVDEYFKTLPWIEKAEIKLSPSWLRCIPKEMGKVKIRVSQ